MWFAGLILGLLVGLAAGHDLWPFGAVVGALAGWALALKLNPGGRLGDKVAALSSKLEDIGRRLEALERRLAQSAFQSAPSQVAQEPTASQPAAAPTVPETPYRAPVAPEPEALAAKPAWEDEPRGEPLEPAAEPNRIVQWLLGGNTVVRVGVVVLFFGVAFLLKYAYEHTHVPLELRLIGVALGAVVLLIFGWRLRHTRPGYALSLQGGGVGLLYLTIFAAFRLYALLPPGPAFILLIAVAAFSAVLAVLQDSLALASVGVAGGFLAPILASTGQGSHVMLFSYYLVLNLGILATAFYKSWRLLNLLGFAFTFVIGTFWGVTRYQPEQFGSTEPFLVAFFLLYLAVPVLYARRQTFTLLHYVDGTLVFGVPLVAFGLQTALVRPYEFGAAWSAFGLAALYLVLASAMWRRAGEQLRLLTESFLALGVGFGTLAIPLAFDGRITSAAWALEGAAIVWVSARQSRKLGLAFGLALQFAAGVAFLFDVEKGYGAVPLLNGFYLGCLFVALGGLFCSAYLYRRRAAEPSWERFVGVALLAWGTLWWAAGGLHEIHRHVAVPLQPHVALIFLATSSVAFSLISKALSWNDARWPAYAIVPIAFLAFWRELSYDGHPFQGWGWIAWPLALLEHLWVLRRHEGQDKGLEEWLHAAGVWLLALVASWEFGWQIDHAVEGRQVWPLIAWAVVPALVLSALTARRMRLVWPVSRHTRSYLLFGPVPLVAFLGAWTLYANFTSNGDPAPLPYLPLLNPLDIAQMLAFLVLVYWFLTLAGLRYADTLSENRKPLYAVFGGMVFIWANGVLLRTLHHWGGVAFRVDAMAHSVLVQSALSLFWSLLALCTMVVATRKGLRALWIVGAALMGVVVVKLFLVDLSSVGTVGRIVSFIGVGVLMLLLGYMSPVPPSLVSEEQK
jgi:uncharacterized membrane protein